MYFKGFHLPSIICQSLFIFGTSNKQQTTITMRCYKKLFVSFLLSYYFWFFENHILYFEQINFCMNNVICMINNIGKPPFFTKCHRKIYFPCQKSTKFSKKTIWKTKFCIVLSRIYFFNIMQVFYLRISGILKNILKIYMNLTIQKRNDRNASSTFSSVFVL